MGPTRSVRAAQRPSPFLCPHTPVARAARTLPSVRPVEEGQLPTERAACQAVVSARAGRAQAGDGSVSDTVALTVSASASGRSPAALGGREGLGRDPQPEHGLPRPSRERVKGFWSPFRVARERSDTLGYMSDPLGGTRKAGSDLPSAAAKPGVSPSRCRGFPAALGLGLCVHTLRPWALGGAA